jgi:hypothetical protein
VNNLGTIYPNPRSLTPLIFTGAILIVRKMSEKALQECDSVCEIFNVEHFVTTAAEAAATAAVMDDGDRGNAQRCVSSEK